MAQLYQPAQAVVAANGTVTLSFGSPGQGYTWTGTVSVLNATGAEQWQVGVGGIPWVAFLGASPAGPIQADGGGVIQITGSGLTPGVTYQAVLIGSVDPTSQASPVAPQPQTLTLAQIAELIGSVFVYPPPVSSSTSGTVNVASGAGATIVGAPPSGFATVCQTLILATSLDAVKQVTIEGLFSGRVYLNFQVPALAAVVQPWIFPLTLNVAEGLTGNVGAGASGVVQFTIAYTLQPLVL